MNNFKIESAGVGHSPEYTLVELEKQPAKPLKDSDIPAALDFEIMASGGQATVASAAPIAQRKSDSYQSEADLETEFIKQLQRQAYEYLRIESEQDLINNLRKQLEFLNDITFTDSEWQRFFKTSIASETDGIVEKTRRIQEDYIQTLKRDDGSSKNIWLIDKNNIHNNRLQVINQYAVQGSYENRYDVTILVNGFCRLFMLSLSVAECP